jgi:hypothetical protein
MRGDLAATRDPAAAIAAYREAHARAADRQMWLFAVRAATRLAQRTAGTPAHGEARAWIADALARCAEPASSVPDFVEARRLAAVRAR